MEIVGQPKEVWNRSGTVWNCRKAAIFADPTFIWKLLASPKRSETGLKPSESVGKQLYLLILHLYVNEWPAQRGLKQVWNRLKLYLCVNCISAVDDQLPATSHTKTMDGFEHWHEDEDNLTQDYLNIARWKDNKPKNW